MRLPLVVLMTATVDPGEYSGQVTRNDIDLRARDYLEAIKFWASYSDPRIQGVVFCENSGLNFCNLETESVEFSPTRPFEVLSFHGNTHPRGVHYGYAELGIIDYACRNSILLKKYQHFVKVTGRYLFPKMTRLIDSLDDDLLVAVDCRRAYRGESGVRLRARTQLMVFDRKFYEGVFQGTREQMLGNCSHIEEFLAQKLLPLYRDRTPGIYLRWKVECPIFGHGASHNRKYTGPWEGLKNVTRSACRCMVPGIWL